VTMEQGKWLRLASALDAIADAAGSLTEFERKLILCRWISGRKVRLCAATADRAYESPDDVRPPPRIQPDDLDWRRSRPHSPWFVGPSAWQYWRLLRVDRNKQIRDSRRGR
jgi:hypothetical protein